MKTIINGMQVTNVEIRKQCRLNHGKIGALEEAFKIIQEKYYDCLNYEINSEATFNLTLTLDR